VTRSIDHTHWSRRTILGAAAATAGALVAPPFARAAGAGIDLSRPLPDPVGQGVRVWDVAPLDYVAEEYLMRGTAPVYQSVTMADAIDMSKRDNVADLGRRSFPPRRALSVSPYCTRLIVYRPRDMSRFSGVALVEPFHPAGGGNLLVWPLINRFLSLRGHVLIGVQHPITFDGVRKADPARYGALAAAHPTQLWGMLADAARLAKGLGGGRLVPASARRLFMTGYSYTGVATATFANFHHNESRAPDGAPLFDGYVPMANATYVRPLDVPVIRFNTQSDFNSFGGLDNRLPDSDAADSRRRLYEAAGAAHAGAHDPVPGSANPPAERKVEQAEHLPQSHDSICRAGFPAGSQDNNLPTRPFMEGIFDNLVAWVEQGTPPPRAPLIATGADGNAALDADGNAIGGLRMADMRVPVAAYGVGTGDCLLLGYRLPFTGERRRALYGDRAHFLARYDAAVDALVAERWIPKESADWLREHGRGDAHI
jgi:hypothetical protein